MNNYQLQIDDLKAQLEAEKKKSAECLNRFAAANLGLTWVIAELKVMKNTCEHERVRPRWVVDRLDSIIRTYPPRK